MCSAVLESTKRPQIDAAVKRAADAAELFAKENILAAMNRFNAAQAATKTRHNA